MAEKLILINNAEQAAALFGSFDSNIKRLEKAYNVTITQHGNTIKVSGKEDELKLCIRAIDELLDIINCGEQLNDQNIDYTLSLVESDTADSMKSIIDSQYVCITAKGQPVKPKTHGQKKYLEAIKNNTITIGVGPAGTGKTYLAVATAVAAYREKQISRIILTRPAVEAGEKLGFLPGDLSKKSTRIFARYMMHCLICWDLKPLQNARREAILRLLLLLI